MLIILIIDILVPVNVKAEENLYNKIGYFKFRSQNSTTIDIITEETNDEIVVKNFNNGILFEQSTRKKGENIIYNEIFDLESENDTKEPQKIESNGVTILVTHHKRSTEQLNEKQKQQLQLNNSTKATETTNIVGAPMDNTGLKVSGYNDGYYYLRDGTLSTIPGVTGKLYRKYTSKNTGLARRDIWNVNTTISAIINAFTLIYSIGSTNAPRVVMSLISFTNNVVSMKQTVETQSYHFDYRYKVRIGAPVYFATDRQRDYWKVFNVNTGKYEWIERVGFRDGFLDSDFAMIKLGIEEYFIGKPILTYQTHVQNIGWQNICSEGDTSGTSGKGLRLEGIKIYLNDNKFNGTIEYRTHVQNEGWKNWVTSGNLSGTIGKGLRLEAIQIRLTGGVASQYRLRYRVHIQNEGWQAWKYDSETSGTSGKSLRLEAIEIRMIRK